MADDELARAIRVFEEVAGLPDAEREARLDSVCGRDPAIRELVGAFLNRNRPASDEVTIALRSAAMSPEAPREPVQTFRIGAYEVVGELGAGGQGRVLLALDPRLGRRVALKLLPAATGLSSQARLRFRREATAASKLNHPSICTIYEVGEHEGMPFLAMQHVEGRSLAELIRGRRQATESDRGSTVPERAARGGRSTGSGGTGNTPVRDHGAFESMRETLDFFEAAARALHAAHEAGLVHRDVKPGNVMVNRDGDRPMIFDFGLASVEGSEDEGLTATGDTMSRRTCAA